LLHKILTSVEELLSYEEALHYLELAAFTVLFWRGHYPVSFRVPTFLRPQASAGTTTTSRFLKRWTRPVTVLLPLHSITAFGWGIFVVQDLNRFPAFLFFAIGWSFLATMEHVRNHPSPFLRCRSYTDMLWALLFNRSFEPESIDANTNVQAIKAFDKMLDARRKQRALEKEEREKLEAEIRKTEVELLEEEDGVDITSHASSIVQSLNPFKTMLKPIVVLLKKLCVALRVAKSIVLWRDSYTAFWIVTASFLATIVLVWIPWSFLILWTCRISAWLFLGPWMKLVDILYIRKHHNYETAEEITTAFEERLKDRYQAVLERVFFQQVNRERAFKLQDLQKYMFGKVSFLLWWFL
jgi:hypothetical protein